MDDIKLPEGWETRKSREGKIFYKNTVTGLTQWEIPTKPAVSESKMPIGWESRQRDNKVFYKNTITGATQWIFPTLPANQFPPDWIQWKTSTGKDIFYNIKTKQMSWKLPTVHIGPLVSSNNPFPLNYKPMIYHNENTCWIAASIWFAVSQQLLLNMLTAYKNSGRKLPTVLNTLVTKMNKTTSKNNREWGIKNGEVVGECLVVKSGYQYGDTEDISRNWNDMLYQIPIQIKEQLYAYSIPIISRKIVDKYGTEFDKQKCTNMYRELVNIYNYMYVKVIDEFRAHIISNDRDDSNLDTILGGLLNEDINVVPQPVIPKFWQTVYQLLTGEYDDNISNKERFCGEVEGYDNKYENLCRLRELLTEINSLGITCRDLGNITEMQKDWGYIIPVNNNISVQYFFDDIAKSEPEVIKTEFQNFNILRTKRITHYSRDKTYITIQLNFPYDMDGTILLPEEGSFIIDERIKVEGNEYILTAVGTKSGDQRRGHWWCLVRDTNSGMFIKYDDIDNENPEMKDMYYINDFNTRHTSALLCYTKI